MLKPNILFVVLDACRADKFYQNKNSKTPTIDSLIKRGAYFSQSISSTDYTMSAISSIFTARYPFGVGETKEPIIEEVAKGLYVGVRLGGMGVAIGSGVGHSLAEMLLS